VINKLHVITFMTVLTLVALAPAQAQTYNVLYSFPGGSAGQYPIPGVIQDTLGNLYGTTANGGSGGSDGYGVVYEVTTSGIEKVLHTFSGGSDGEYPYAAVLRDREGNLYGATNSGGNSEQGGVVYKIDNAGKETILHAFAGGTSDGCNPFQGLIMDSKGNLYGTTNGCGAYNGGTVFKLTLAGNETVLHSFAEGSQPSYYGHLLMDKAGDIYGVLQVGGSSNDGVLYELGAKGKFTVLHNFAGGPSDGQYSSGSVAGDEAENLYGITYKGGTHDLGVVWEVSKEGKETILHNFAGGASDSCSPVASVIRDSQDNLYGNSGCGAYGYGAAWELSKNGTLTLLHSFENSPDGENPFGAELLRTAKGDLYSVILEGGTAGYGTVWAYLP
jgi:uncharacterized repeat protein (TIGR03803 family)